MTKLDERSKNDILNALNVAWSRPAWSLIVEMWGVHARDRLWYELCGRLSDSFVEGGTFNVVRQTLSEEKKA